MNNNITSEIIGWLANIALIWAQFELGNKKRYAFLLIASGELAWVYASYLKGSLSMLVICVIFTGLSIRNYVKLDNLK